MRGLIGLAAAAGIVLIAGGTAMAVTPQPAAGNYATVSFVVSNTNSLGGACPGSAAGTYYNGHFTYPGPSSTGAVAYNPGLDGATGFVQLVTFTTATPTAGTHHWNGSGVFSSSPSGGSTTTAFTFQWIFTFFTAAAFEADVSYKVPGITKGTCTQTNHMLFIQTN